MTKDCTYTITLNGTLGPLSAEVGGGVDSEGDGIGVAGIKGSALLVNVGIAGKLDQGDGFSGSVKSELIGGKGGIGFVGGYSISVEKGFDSSDPKFVLKEFIGIGAGVDANGTGALTGPSNFASDQTSLRTFDNDCLAGKSAQGLL